MSKRKWMSLEEAAKRAGGIEPLLRALSKGKLPNTRVEFEEWISMKEASERAGGTDALLAALRAGSVRARAAHFESLPNGETRAIGITCAKNDVDRLWPLQ
jgi:hypothetical protein